MMTAPVGAIINDEVRSARPHDWGAGDGAVSRYGAVQSNLTRVTPFRACRSLEKRQMLGAIWSVIPVVRYGFFVMALGCIDPYPIPISYAP